MAAFKFQLHGFKELDKALAQLPKAVGKAALRTAAIKAMEPVRAAAEAGAPRDTGELAESQIVGTRLIRTQQTAARKAGGVTVYAGSHDPKDHLLEFGTSDTAAQPFMRPAWEAHKNDVLEILRRELWIAIAKAAKRLAKQAEVGSLSKVNRRFFSK